MSQYNDKSSGGGWNLPEHHPPQAVKNKIDASLNNVRFAGQVIDTFMVGLGSVLAGLAIAISQSSKPPTERNTDKSHTAD